MSLWSLKWEQGTLVLLDQTKLPGSISYIRTTSYKEVASAIKVLAVRGAPAIGVAAAYAMVLAAREIGPSVSTKEDFDRAFHEAGSYLTSARPTAVNLAWAVGEMEKTADQFPLADFAGLTEMLEQRAEEIDEDDKSRCSAMADAGAALFSGMTHLHLLTHCNTGALATAGIGTAFGVIRRLHERGQVECVYADETRPLLQGARLTAMELRENHIPYKLITDSMAGAVMRSKGIDAVLTGADRITANGDGANKIGTYSLAVLARYHQIPFYLVAPFSTFDLSLSSGDQIPIEERTPDEVRTFQGVYAAPKDAPVYNPAFDVVPHELITGIITEKGVLRPPFRESIRKND